VVAVIVVALAAVVWILSGMIGDNYRIPQPEAGYPMTITSADATRVAYTGVPSGWTDQGLYAIATSDGGYALTADPAVGTDGTGARTVTDQVSGPTLAEGQKAALDGWYFGADPSAVLGLPFEDVTYDSPLGATPAWLIPGESDTWVVYAHGRSDTPAQGLRMAATFADLGYPMLLIRYRNDAGAPAGSGYGQHGVDEWPDIEAAVQYALDKGATTIVLAGTSMGAAAELAFLESSPLADRVVGAVFDAPAVNTEATVDKAAGDMGVPGFVTSLAKTVASWRFGLDWTGMDYVSRAAAFETPMLITQGSEDGTALPQQTAAFAAAATPDIVQLEVFEGAGHTLAWNMEPERYDTVLAGFLGAVTATQ
jgi:pimeloyl-ACP methyl ester carboxylesterase